MTINDNFYYQSVIFTAFFFIKSNNSIYASKGPLKDWSRGVRHKCDDLLLITLVRIKLVKRAKFPKRLFKSCQNTMTVSQYIYKFTGQQN